VDEPLDATSCGGKENCNIGRNGRSGKCMTHDLWATLSRKMVEYLDSVSLQDLVDQQRLREWQESGQLRTGLNSAGSNAPARQAEPLAETVSA
jgi:Rrf2 family iron-sulfur cluster assembly transcriptional regulator